MVDVPRLQFLMIDRRGDPNTAAEYADALATPYPMAYGLKFASSSEVGGLDPHGTPGRGGPFVQMFSDDLDATVGAVKAAGGEVVDGPYGFPGGRRFHFLDPAGNGLGAWSEQ